MPEHSLLLSIDSDAVPLRQNLCLYMSRPAVRPDPVLTPQPRESDAPDNLAAMFYGTVLADPGPFGGRFRMWYHACHWGMNPDWPADIRRQFTRYRDPILMGPVCYAESDDGVVWRKPALDQVLFKGSRQNNAIDLPHGLTAGVNVIRDQADPDPARRYKMVYEIFPRHSDPPLEGQGRMSTIATAVSPDGLRWSFTGVPYVDHFIEQSGFYQHQGRYIVSYQAGDGWGSHFSEGGHASGRCGLVRYSLDFDHWVEGFVESLALPEPADPALRGSKQSYDHNHLGVAPASFGEVCVGLYGLWHNRPDFAAISCDLGLAVSRDGLVFHEPAKGRVFIGSDESPVSRRASIDFNTNLTQGNGILNAGDQTLIYHGRWRNTGFERMEDYYGEVALATLPRDRWGGLGLFPNREQGVCWTREVKLCGGDDCVTVNADGAEGIAVDVVGPRFEPLAAGLGLHGDSGLDLAVAWPDGLRDRIVGRPVRLGLRFRRGSSLDPRVYAVRIRS